MDVVTKEDPTERDDAPESAEHDEVLERARERFAQVQEADEENRRRAKRAIEFVWVRGKQWLEEEYAFRLRAKRAALEVNQLPQFVRAVVNDMREQRPGIRVSPASGSASKEVAEILQGMCRHIEYDSHAEAIYDTAYEHAVTGGRGYWRIVNDYENSRGFEQKLSIVPVPDPMMVYGDEDYQQPDASDRNYLFLVVPYRKDEFERKWPKAKALSYDLAGDTRAWFADRNTVWVAEYYERTLKKRVLVRNSDGAVGFKDEMPALPPGVTTVSEREVEQASVMHYIIAGGEQVLEEHQWPGEIIPVVTCFGATMFIDGKRVYKGLIDDAMDSQVLYNWTVTNLAEQASLATKAPWVLAEGQDEGHEDQWETANRIPWSRLLYKPTTVDGVIVPGPQRTQPAQVDPSMALLAQLSQANLRSTTGIYDPSLGQRSNETSGRAILAREKQGDNSTFHFPDNLARAIALTGRILVQAIPAVYDTPRIVHIIQPDDTQKQVAINTQVPQIGPGGVMGAITQNDLSEGEFAVTVESGPSYATKRQETADRMIDLTKVMPMVAAAAPDLILKSVDVPDADQIAERVRMTLPPAIQQMIQAREGGRAPPDPQVMAQMQQMGQQMQQMQAAMQQLQAENQKLKSGVQEKVAGAQMSAQVDREAAQAKLQLAQEEAAAKLQAAREQAEQEASLALYKARLEAAVALERATMDSETKLTIAQAQQLNVQPAQDVVGMQATLAGGGSAAPAPRKRRKHTFTYDDAGNIASATDQDGRTFRVVYDPKTGDPIGTEEQE